MFLKPEIVREIVLNTTEPLIIKNQLNWQIVNWTLNDWQQALKDETLQCRRGKNILTKEPQWERTTILTETTMDDFIKFTTNNLENEWLYFDYKYLKDWFLSNNTLRNSINWSKFGFAELTAENSTIWIGTKGAHSPCHIDTYGCNMIAQIYGKKEWLVFPPEQDLKPTRIPYEESSIFSKLNFFSPRPQDFYNIDNCRRIILECGDILILPHKWWHYVENLETAISINVWLSLPQDDRQRLSEAVVQMFFSRFCKDIDSGIKNVLLNPNSDREITNDFNQSIDLIDSCRNILENQTESQQTNKSDWSSAINNCNYIRRAPKLTKEEFRKCIDERASRFKQIENSTSIDSKFTDIIEACTHPDVISKITEKLIKHSN